jgi:pSer/pThr/pTyr-binding forkhead associated (FHA) protein
MWRRIALAKAVFTIGRSEDCDLSVPLFTVSRHHARLQHLEGRWHIECDKRSCSPIHLNHQLVMDLTPLTNNDVIDFGDFTATFEESRPPVSQVNNPTNEGSRS